MTQNVAGRTDAAGKHSLRIDFDSVSPIRATSISAQSTVQDVNQLLKQWQAMKKQMQMVASGRTAKLLGIR